MPSNHDLLARLGETDVYLLDQFMKRRFDVPGRVLDAGCGSGRNLDLFLHGGHEVWLADRKAENVERAREHARGLGVEIPDARCVVGELDEVDLPVAHFDAVLCIAVLHFARDPAHWNALVDAVWRTVATGGLFFARLASSIGIETCVERLGNGRCRLGDGSERYLVTEADLLNATERLGAELVEPIKSVNVQNQRCMTTWVLRRPTPTERALRDSVRDNDELGRRLAE